MKTYILALFILISNTCLHSQGNYNGSSVTYESCTNCTTSNYMYSGQIDTFNTEQVISDFGPRYLSAATPYDFHGGVDYTITLPNNAPPNDLGYHIISIEGGTILRLRIYPSNNPARKLKYIVIDGPNNSDYGYLHLFDDTTLPTTIGDMSFIEINDPYPNTIVYGIYDSSNNRLLSDCNGGTCDSTFYYVPIIGDTIYATNQVTANAHIGILGTSGGIGSHLHLSKYNELTGITDFVNNDANAVDPLQTCEHKGPNYEIEILHDSTGANIDQYPSGVALTYPGNNTSSILIRPIMPDTNNGNINNGILSNGNRYYLDNTMNIHKTEIFLKQDFVQTFNLIEGPFYESKFHLGARQNGSAKYPPHISVRNANNVGTWTRTGIQPLAYKTNNPRRWDDFYFSDFISRIHQNDPMDGDTTPTQLANCPEFARYPDGQYELFAEVTDVRDSTFYSDTLSFELDNWKPYIDSVSMIADQVIFYNESWDCQGTCTNFSNTGHVATMDSTDFVNGLRINVSLSEPIPNLTLDIPVYNISNMTISGIQGTDSTQVYFQIAGNSIVLGQITRLYFNGQDVAGNDLISFTDAQLTACTEIPHQIADSMWMPGNYTYGTDSIHFFTFECSAGNKSNRKIITNPSIIRLNNYDLVVTKEIIHDLNNQSNGSIDITILGGNEPYTFDWYSTTDINFGSSNEDVFNLAAGEYCVNIEDDLCGSISECFTVYDCSNFNIFSDVTSACGTDEDGEINLSTNSIHLPINYTWDNGSSGNTVSALAPGNYCVTVTDTLGCVFLDCYTVNQKYVLLGIAHHGYIPCEGTKGMLSAIPTSEAIAPIDYNWSNGESTQTIDELDPGYYFVTVTDATGCSTNWFINLHIVNPTPMLYEDEDLITDHVCATNPASTGSISFRNPFGPGHKYSWTGPNGFTSSTMDISGLSMGEYCVTVKKIGETCIVAKGCVTIRPMDEAEVNVVDIENVYLCKDGNFDCDGSLTIAVSPGASISWISPPQHK